jgi:hypothetical protein
MKLSRSSLALSLLLVFGVAACSTSHPTTDASGAPAKTKAEIKAEKVAAKEEAEAKKYPPPPANSPLAKIHRDMTDSEVRAILGPPTSAKSYQNGKQWIPYYGAFAPDIARTEWVYKGLGLVTFNQNRYNGGLFVLRVTYDPNR